MPRHERTADPTARRGTSDSDRPVTLADLGHRIEPIILHEQASGGATLIEKLEKYGPTAGFAVVLATGDDIARVATADVDADRPRARQNVILELGYFFGVLGREKVVLLYGPGVEIPWDIDGLVYVETDSGGAWKIELTREIEAAGYTVDRTALR
jgi:predicted nucleotide-binding protein